MDENALKKSLYVAIDWHFRLLTDDATEAEWLEFEAWLLAAEENRAAYDQVERMAVEIASATGTAKVRALRRHKSFTPNLSHLASQVWPAGSLRWVAASGVLILLVWGLLAGGNRPHSATYATEKGKTLIVRLEDGSVVRLNTASKIDVHFNNSTRAVEMDRGEASFDVAKDAGRPFVIGVADRKIRVVGTEFNILSQAKRLTVTLRRGLLDVLPQDGDAAISTVELHPGQQLVRNLETRDSVVRDVDPEIAFAWREGRLIYRDSSLWDVVSDLNRYFAVPIQVDDDARALRFSGVLTVDGETAVIQRLQEFLPLSVESSGGTITLHLKKE